jgi:2-methylisocitrate lyase-like PEP mutase family enzyme
VTVDVEGGYSDDPATCARNIGRFLDLGVVGINFEDRVVGGAGLHGIEAQSARIAAIRAVADARGIALFINARTDLFFAPGIAPAAALDEACARAAAYQKAGASGLFVPGLVDLEVIAALCDATSLPVNVMMAAGLPERQALARAGVARISHGPGPYLQAIAATRAAAQAVFG